MGVQVRAKFEVSSIILIGFRQGGSPPPLQNEQIRVNNTEYVLYEAIISLDGFFLLQKKQSLRVFFYYNRNKSHQNTLFEAKFNLLAERYLPFRRISNKPLSINAKSNHLYTIIKELPESNIFLELSCNEEYFPQNPTRNAAVTVETKNTLAFCLKESMVYEVKSRFQQEIRQR